MQPATRTLSILIVAFNERKHIGRLKESIDRLEKPADLALRTVLIDGGSSDGTAEHAGEIGFDQVLVIPGGSIPVCRNAGLKESDSDWLAYIDADCELAPGWLSTALPFLEAEEAVVIGWPVRPPEPGTWVQRAWYTHWTNKNPRMGEWQGHRVVTHEAFRLLTTRNLVMNREIADTLGGFDEELPTGEDTDFVFRAYQRDLAVLAVPGLDVVHHGEPETLGEFFKQQKWHANRSSYTKIMRESKGQTGGNAPRFTVLYLLTGLLFNAGLILALVFGDPRWLLLLLPWCGLIAGPATLIGLKAGKPGHILPLCALYATYGLARVLDFVGFYREKPSWKG